MVGVVSSMRTSHKSIGLGGQGERGTKQACYFLLYYYIILYYMKNNDQLTSKKKIYSIIINGRHVLICLIAPLSPVLVVFFHSIF